MSATRYPCVTRADEALAQRTENNREAMVGGAGIEPATPPV